MAGDPIIIAASAFVALTLALQLVSIALVYLRLGRQSFGAEETKAPPVSVLRPLCGLENNLEETLGTTFKLDHPKFEVLFCVASPSDPAIAVAQKLIGEHPGVRASLLIGDDRVSGNPKLNNLVKGWAAARHDWIVMCDSNVLLPPDYLRVLQGAWDGRTGLVSAPPAGIRPQGFWARLECAFLNSYQARWQLAADQIGLGFAQGKNLYFKRDLLEAAGGIARLGSEMAEDVASTKITRKAGLKVRVAPRPFAQPIGRRSFADVWARQLRWSRVRRFGFVAYFLPEVLSGALLPVLATSLLIWLGAVGWWALPALLALWYGAEFMLAARAGWPRSLADALSWIVRDALIVPLWIGAWMGAGFVWRGNAMKVGDVPVQAAPSPPGKQG